MNALTPIPVLTAAPAPGDLDVRPVVLRFAGLHPKDLGRFKMHDRRTGGDLSHVDLEQTAENKIEFGAPSWMEDLHADVATAARLNLAAHTAALTAKSRKKEAAAVAEAGLVDPWQRCQRGPLREGILTVNKSWLGGTGIASWHTERVQAFREHALTFLQAHFPDDQLRFVSSHADEESFHLHFVVAVWTQRETANRGCQRVLQASANPLLANYEHAQDLAGEHFERIGLRRGERHAAARRKARADNQVPEPARQHVPPSEYRADAVAKAETEKRKITDAARLEAAQLVEAGRQLGQSAVRKSRTRAIREARERKAAVAKEEADAIRRREAALAVSVKAEEAAQRARFRKEQEEKAAKVITERARHHLSVASRAEEKIHALKKDMERMEVWRRSVQRTVTTEEEKKDAAMKIAAAAKREQAIAQVSIAAAQKRRLEEEDRVIAAKEHADTLKHANSVAADRLVDLGRSLELLATGAIAWHPATQKRSGRIGFGSLAPVDAEKRSVVVQTVKSAGPWLQRIARLVHASVNAVIGRERKKLADDAAYIATVRAEMGLDEDTQLARISARRGEMPAIGL